MPPDLLEVGELGDLHAVEPHLPAEPPCAQRGRFPVVFHEPYVVVRRVDAEAHEARQIYVLDIEGRGLHDHLELVVVLEPVRVLAVPAVGGPPRRLHVGGIPGFRAEDLEERGRVEGARPHFHVIGLPYHAPPARPEFLQLHDQVLEVHDTLSYGAH